MRFMLVFDDIEEAVLRGGVVEVTTLRREPGPLVRTLPGFAFGSGLGSGPRVHIPPGMGLQFRLTFEAADMDAALWTAETVTREGAPVGKWHIEPLDGMAEHGATS